MRRFIFILILICGICAHRAVAQSKSVETLTKEIKRAEDEIRKNTALLNETQKNKTASQREIKLIQDRINSRKNIVEALMQQIELMNEDMSRKKNTVSNLEKKRDQLTEEYAEMIRQAYKNYLQNNYLAFLFAAKDFDDVTRRINYMRRYNKMREDKARQIDSLSGVIATRIVEIDMKLHELDQTKAVKANEIAALDKDEKKYKTSIANLTAQESKLSKEISNRRKQIERAQKEIDNMVKAEVKKNDKKPLSAQQQKEVKELSGRFDQNKGKLPWPVRGGVIIDRYGQHAHPTQRGITVDNKGVNIAASKGAEVRSVFEGTVANIFFYQGLNNNVMVRHGEYITVYSNLASVAVKVGDRIALNQTLGRLPSGDDQDEYTLHFELWKQSTNLNPEPWLIR